MQAQGQSLLRIQFLCNLNIFLHIIEEFGMNCKRNSPFKDLAPASPKQSRAENALRFYHNVENSFEVPHSAADQLLLPNDINANSVHKLKRQLQTRVTSRICPNDLSDQNMGTQYWVCWHHKLSSL